jgi:coenzyme F420 hydrogenase subunit alpha
LSQTVVVSPTTRHEGHAKLVLEVDDNGIVTQGNYLSITPVRGFEKFITGKPMEFAPVASSRFCGICPITHASASTDAIDRALGIKPPKNGLVLKHLCNKGNLLHSHPLHNLLLLPDFVKDPNAALAATVRIQKMRKIGQNIVDITGGEAIHAPNIRIGGMAHNISEAAKRKILESLTAYEPIMKEQVEFMISSIKNSDVPATLGVHNNELMATDLHYGNADLFEEEYFYRFTEITPRSWYPKAEVGEECCTTVPLIGGKAVEGGPKARMTRFADFGAKDTGKFDPKGAMAINIARQMEIPIALAKAKELATQLDTTKPTMMKAPEMGGDGERLGVAPQEAPRGVNVHTAKVKNGKISYYNCLVATTWNIPTVGKACEGQHYKWAEYVVRAYDPCVSCATHLIVVDEDGKVVAEDNI